MKKARMNISHLRFVLSNLKIFGEMVTPTLYRYYSQIQHFGHSQLDYDQWF